MRQLYRPIIGIVCLLALLTIAASCSPSESNPGVAHIDDSRPPAIRDSVSVDNSGLTDEEITTLFTNCMRDNGYDVSDPELNADGTIDFQELRANFAQIIGDADNPQRATAAVGACRPLLAGATFTQPLSDEDEIEVQDRILELAQCLRDNGIDVSDPDFSVGSRASIQLMLQQANVNVAKNQEAIQSCAQTAFSGFDRES